MAMTNAERQRAFKARLRAGIAPVIKVIKAPAPTTRKARLAAIVSDLTRFRDEYQTWVDGLAEDYAERSEENAERVADVEAFLDSMGEALDALDGIEPPRIRLD
jgi:hypothetical protein